jgi:hypothetical protein
VSISTSSSGFVFQNNSAQWVWVSFAILDCQGVASSYGCAQPTWQYPAVSLAPSGGGNSSQSCALMPDISTGAATYSYKVQWIAYADPSNGNDFQPSSLPAYPPSASTITAVTESAGTDHGANTCVPPA